MVGKFHAGMDALAIKLADLNHHNLLQWVDPPDVAQDIPLGQALPAPGMVEFAWPQGDSLEDVASPVAFLGAPNHMMRIRWWSAQARRRGTVVFVPPWNFSSFLALMPVVRGLTKMGFDVMGYPTPYHFERTPPGSFSGEFFATWDMPRTGWAIRTAALEICALVEAAGARGPVALVGLSLGGYLSSMASAVAALYPTRSFAAQRMCLVVPPESILDTLRKTAIGERYRQLLIQGGGTLPDDALLERLAKPFSPSRFPSVVKGEHIFVAAGRHDSVVPLESTRTLAKGLNARLQEYEAGHVTGLAFTPALWRDAAAFMQEMPELEDTSTP